MPTANQAPPMFKYVSDGGKFQHPWMRPLPAGRAKVYDLLYKATTTAFFGLAMYGMVEMGRGMYYITAANYGASAPTEAAASQTSEKN